jgi:glycosyltransferase involved in cell wall biosynthesis
MTRALVVHAGNIAGGVEQVILTMVRLTRAHGAIDLHIALAFEGPVAAMLRDAGATVQIFGPVRASRPISVWQARERLAAVLKRVDPEVVLTQSAWSLGLFGGVARKTGVPVVHWVHDTLTGGHWTERLASRRRPDLLVCNSQYTARSAASVFPTIPHVVLYAPARRPRPAGESRATLRARWSTSEDQVVIAQVGRTDPLKGHRVLVDALAGLEADRRWTCWLVGAPQSAGEQEYWDAIRTLVGERGLAGRVRFLGYQEDVAALLQASDIYCQTNVGPEAFGLTLLEAMSASLPVVTSDMGAAPEVLEGTGNALVPPGDPSAVASALRALLDDPALRRARGDAGARRARALGDPEAAHGILLAAIDRVRRVRCS